MEPVGHVHDELSGYLNGDLPEARRQAVQAHLAECRACRQDLASLRLTVRGLQSLPLRPAPRSFALPRTAAATPSWFSWLRMAGGALAAAVVVFVAVQFLLPRVTAPTSAPRFAAAPAATDSQPPRLRRAPEDAASGPVIASAPVDRPASGATPAAKAASDTGARGARPAAGPPASSEASSRARSAAEVPAANGATASSADSGAPQLALRSAAEPAAPAMPSSEASPYPPPGAAPPVPPLAAGSATDAYPAPPSPLTPAAQAPVPAGAAAPGPVATASHPRGLAAPVWYTPGLGLLALLALIAATVLFALDRRRRS